jgi:hypothetical protein
MKFAFPSTILVAIVVGANVAQAGEDDEAFARVVVEETALRSGPGVSHRTVYVAHRGETFAI